MKIILLFLLLAIGLYINSFGQNRLLSTQSWTLPIGDTTSSIDRNKYYLINNSEYRIPKKLISRRLENNYIIVKGAYIPPLNVGIKYVNLQDIWKLSPWFSMETAPSSDRQGYSIKYSNRASLDFIYDNDEIKVLRELEQSNILIIEATYEVIINNVVHNGGIEYVDILHNTPIEESPLRQYSPDLNRISTAKHDYPSLSGQGIIVSLKENAINEDDIDLLGKVTVDVGSSSEFTQHAKEMGTAIAGLGNSHLTGEGVAIDAFIVCTDFASLFAEEESYYNQHSITVQNHSYGTGIENFYGTETISYDQLAMDKPSLVHVFSAGNAGSLAPDFGLYADIEGYANITGNYKQAKNVLVIAALDSTLNHVSVTSSGPAYDGRVKPELGAFGGEGTSESAALVSGSVALIQAHFNYLRGDLPSSALVKSLLIAGANEAHTRGIDFRTGYGSVNLNRSLQLMDKQHYIESSVAVNSSYVHELKIPENIAELKLVVSWIDPPASPGDATALVNDLDMTLTAPDNTQWLPWILNPSPNRAALEALPIRSEDHLNNVEMITIENPDEGLYHITINASQLQGTNQAFSIAYDIKEKDVFEWSYPTSSDHLSAGSSPYFRWENSFVNQAAELSIKYGEGNWEPIGGASLEDELYKYTLKDTTITASLKMSIDGIDYFSNTFSITQNLKLSVENDCETNFVLSWGDLENTASYTLYELQSNNRLIPILKTTDTLVTLNKADFQGNYYSIEPNQKDGLEGLKSFSINAENQNAGCYITSFLALLDVDGVGNVRLTLNVPFQIEEVIINKEFEQSSSVFQQFSPGNQSSFVFEDRELSPGIYYYSTQLQTNSGEIIYSDTLSLFYTDDNTVIAFPNPVEDNFVNILNNYPGGTLQLLDTKGALIKNYDLVNIVESIELTGLEKGVYVFKIIYKDKIVNSGRIVRL